MNFLLIPIYYQECYIKNPNIFSGSSNIISTMKAFIAWKTYVYAIVRSYFERIFPLVQKLIFENNIQFILKYD